MTIELNQIDFTYAGDGAETDFPTPYFQFPEDIAASLRPAIGDAQQLVYGIDFSLSGALAANGGTLTIISPAKVPGPSVGTLMIRTAVPPTQKRAFPRGGAISNLVYERTADKLTMLILQLLRGLERSIHAPDEDLAGPMLLPFEYLRAGGFLGFDGTGLPLVYSLAELVDLLTPLIIGTVSVKTLPKSREELGLLGDGGTDDSFQLVKQARIDSANGGATYFLQPRVGETFYFKWGVALPSNINVIFSGLGASFGDGAFLKIAGDVAQDLLHPLALSSDVAIGDTRLFFETGASGGGPVSNYLAVGDRFVILGFRDGADNAQRGEYTVIAVDTVSVTIASPGAEFNFLVTYPDADYKTNWGLTNATQIFKIITCNLQLDAAIGDVSVTVDLATVGLFQIFDYVQIEDDKRAIDQTPGASTTRYVHRELVQITGISANVVTFNRKLEHNFETTFRARLVLMDLAQGASVSGCSAAFTTVPTVSAPTFEISRGLDCIMANPLVANDDPFGSLGPMFRIYQSLNSTIEGAIGRNHKSLVVGGGRGLVIQESTGCSGVEADIAGCRVNAELICATQCHVPEALLADDRSASVSFAGNGEVGCNVTLRGISGGGLFAPGVTKKRAIRLGDTSGMFGPFRCTVEDGRVGQYKGTGTAAVEFVAGCEECRVTSTLDDITTALWGEDSPMNGAATGKKNTIACTVNGYDGKLVDVHGGRNGSGVKTVQDLKIDLRAFDGSRHVNIQQVDGCRVRVDLDKVTPDVTEPFGITAFDVARLAIWRSDLLGVRAGISLQNCPSAYVVKCILADFVGTTTILRDGGGNTNMVWTSNDVLGFTGTVDTPGTPSTGISTTYPVLIT